jgi:hypothetical protein
MISEYSDRLRLAKDMMIKGNADATKDITPQSVDLFCWQSSSVVIDAAKQLVDWLLSIYRNTHIDHTGKSTIYLCYVFR